MTSTVVESRRESQTLTREHLKHALYGDPRWSALMNREIELTSALETVAREIAECRRELTEDVSPSLCPMEELLARGTRRAEVERALAGRLAQQRELQVAIDTLVDELQPAMKKEIAREQQAAIETAIRAIASQIAPHLEVIRPLNQELERLYDLLPFRPPDTLPRPMPVLEPSLRRLTEGGL